MINIIKYFFGVIIMILGSITASFSASIINSDSKAYILIVRGEGKPYEVTIEKGQKIEICRKGCFVTFPDGDCHALVGSDKVEIVQGFPKIQ